VRAFTIGLALSLLGPAYAQQPAPKNKPRPAAKQVAHKKPTPQQIRRFDELEKKQDGKTR
jgi:hypothetical protein